MPLEEYRRKRDAARTPEPVPAHDPPAGDGPGRNPEPRFVIQEHHARALHWDVRLERDGVLASWAVPKGLPVDAGTVRLAVRTEDHPLEYLDFSGDIPAGEYGGGSMSIWDSGTYDTEKWNSREVAVHLHGRRAQGRFVFIRSERGEARPGRQEWLLRRSGGAPDRVALPRVADVVAVHDGELPTGTDVVWQIGFGGRRVLVRVDGGRSTVLDAELDTDGPAEGRASGIELDVPVLRALGPALGATPVLLDGELVGSGSAARLWISDVLHLDGRDTTTLPFTQRRALLDELGLAGPAWRAAPVFDDGAPDAVLAAARQQGLPYVLAKPSSSTYDPDGPGWVRASSGVDPPGPVAWRPAGAGESGGVGRARLSNPRKVLYPLTATTKADVAAHYQRVAAVMLPHLAGRPVTMVRWPDGVERGSFFEKDVSRHAPRWIRTARLPTPGGRGESAEFPLLDDAEALAWAANLAALELHVPQWTVGRRGAAQPPDLLVFDLDPGEGATVLDCARVAERIAERIGADGLTAVARTSGGKGMQVYAAVSVGRAEQTSQYARAVAHDLAEQTPRTVTAEMAKARRHRRVFIDWSQNNPYKTTIASYSLRGRSRPTVATPLTWAEVGAARSPGDLVFTLDDLPDRLERHGDLLAGLLTSHRPPLPHHP